jgi:hypothetical protein
MTYRDLLLNFVRQYKKPFSAEIAANMTDLPKDTVEQILPELMADHIIKLISGTEAIYVRCQRYNPIVGYNQKGGWKFDPQAAAALLDLLESQSYYSIRMIAKDFGRSRQWVFVYLEALASQGNIGVRRRGNIYYVISKDNLNTLGSIVKPGILGDLRSPHGEQRKQVCRRSKEERELERQQMLERWEQRERERQARVEFKRQEYQEKLKQKQEASLRRQELTKTNGFKRQSK